jgi:hypothetical protein
MNGITIFWRKDQAEIINRPVNAKDFQQSSMLKYLYCPCVWNGELYGRFAQTEQFKIYWENTPVSHFPPEFRASLLLLGAS